MYSKDIQKLFDRYPFDSLANIIYRYLYDQIITLKIKPGEKLNISQLATELSVSRTTIREAITTLISDALVVQDEQNRLTVTELNTYDMFDIYESRKILELDAARRLCEYITPNELKLLTKYANDFKKAIEQRSYLATFEADKNYHRLIIDSCRNKYIKIMYQSIAGTVDRNLSYGTVVLTAKADDNYPFFSAAINQHFMIIRAFESGIPDNVATILNRHLEDATKVVSYPGAYLKL
jgi:DNA-binding GntR family transcriptional regulator